MPLPTGPCDIPITSCCDVPFDDGAAMLNGILAGLAPCFVGECLSPPLKAFVSWGQPATSATDYLAAILSGVELDSANRIGLYRVSWSIRLAESGFPTPSTSPQGIVDVDLDRVHAVTRHAIAHGVKMLAVIHQLNHAGTLLPAACSGVRVSSLRPSVGGGDVIGGSIGSTVDISYVRPMG